MVSEKPRVTIYTDGGADPNPGPGGWGVVLFHDASGRLKELSGGEPQTTNNRMELTAAIRALEALKEPCAVHLYTDSEYLQRGITEWLPDWIARDWKRKRGELQNEDLWRRLAALLSEHNITWEWVKGHAGNPYNERADALATREIRAHYADDADVQTGEAEIYLLVSARDGVGGWAALVRFQGDEQVISGSEVDTTSNRLDLLAAVEALSILPEHVSVCIYSYADYLRHGASRWIAGWRKRGWRKKDGEPVKHADLWQQLDAGMQSRRVVWPSLKDEPIPPLEFEDLSERVRQEVSRARS